MQQQVKIRQIAVQNGRCPGPLRKQIGDPLVLGPGAGPIAALEQLFAVPGVVWLILLFLVPFYAVIGVAFGGVDPIFQQAVPSWNPFNWNFTVLAATLAGFLPGNQYWDVFVRTVGYVALALVVGQAFDVDEAFV